MRFEWFVASRYLRSRRKQSFISIISIISIGGVSLGVATVILVSAILDGVEQGLKDRFLANEAHVVFRLHDNSFFDDYQKRISQIETIDEVVATSPVVWAQSAVLRERSDTIQDVIYIKGIDPVQEDKVTGFSKFVDGSTELQDSQYIEDARLIRDETITGGIVLGGRLAARLGVIKGDMLRLIVNLAKHPVNESMLIPDLASFVVIGFYESELAVYDNNFGFIHLEAAQKMYNKKNQVNTIFVRLTDAELAPRIARRIEDKVQFSVLEGMPDARTWMEMQAPLFSALRLEKIATVIIEALIILDSREHYRNAWNGLRHGFGTCSLLAPEFQFSASRLLVRRCPHCANFPTSANCPEANYTTPYGMDIHNRCFMAHGDRVRALLCC